MSEDRLISLEQTAQMLDVCPKTLRDWDKQGKLVPVKTAGGHRRYKLSVVHAFMGTEEAKIVNNPAVCIYGRVSSHDQKQKGDLDRQCQRLSEYCAKKKYKVEYILKDVGSGLSDNRKSLMKVFDLVIGRKISKVVIENKDRLTRFQFNVFTKFFESYSVAIECSDQPTTSDEEELVNDIMMLMASFSGKLYGRRSARRKKEQKIKV